MPSTLRRSPPSRAPVFSALAAIVLLGASFASRGLDAAGTRRVQHADTVEPARFAAIAPLVTDAIARHELPGAVVLIGKGDDVLYRRAFGDRAVAPVREAMT